MFSAGSPLGDRQQGEDVPATFEPLTVGNLVRGQPRLPGCLCTDTVREVGAGLGAAISTTLYVLSLRLSLTYLKMFRPGPWNPASVSHLNSLGTVARRW